MLLPTQGPHWENQQMNHRTGSVLNFPTSTTTVRVRGKESLVAVNTHGVGGLTRSPVV